MIKAQSHQHSLARHISLRVGLIAFVTSIVQLLVVVCHNYFDYEDLALGHVRREAHRLKKGITLGADGLQFKLPAAASYYGDDRRDHYAYRIMDGSGRIISGEQATLLERVSPSPLPYEPGKRGLWFKNLDDKKRFHFAGGAWFRVSGQNVLIEIATLGDPAGNHWWVVASETLEDIWFPILPFTLLIPIATVYTVRNAMNFLARAAQETERMEPGNLAQRVELQHIPEEARAFAVSINRLLDRVGDLIRSKQTFMAQAAHQLRTPLASITLELEKIESPRARLVEKDVGAMSDTVDRLLTLLRLQAVETPDFVDLNIGTVVDDAVRGLRRWAKANCHDIQMVSTEPGNLVGDPVAIREALVNLVENAVKHTPNGTAIRVIAGPGCTATVEDGGSGLPPGSSEELFRPFRKGKGSTDGVGLGLAIVRHAVDLHNGTIEVGRSTLGGAMFKLRFA
jgi:signal transduction histidine kinase